MPLLPQWERPFEPLLEIAVMPPRPLSKRAAYMVHAHFLNPTGPMASFGFIFCWGPTPVTQGAGRAPVPKGVRHRDCYTPTLVWAVTIEMHRTPPHEVGGWGRPQSGRLVEKQRRRFSSCQVGKCAGCLLKTTLAGAPPAQYSLFPPSRAPFPTFGFLIYNETNRVGAQAELGPI